MQSGNPVPLLARYIKGFADFLSSSLELRLLPRLLCRDRTKRASRLNQTTFTGSWIGDAFAASPSGRLTCRIALSRRSLFSPLWRFFGRLCGPTGHSFDERITQSLSASYCVCLLYAIPRLRLRRLPGILHPRQLSVKQETTPNSAAWQHLISRVCESGMREIWQEFAGDEDRGTATSLPVRWPLSIRNGQSLASENRRPALSSRSAGTPTGEQHLLWMRSSTDQRSYLVRSWSPSPDSCRNTH